MSDKIFCKNGGCSAKLGAKKLSHILSMIEPYHDERLLAGFDHNEDAAVYQINDETAIVSTLDFFPPMVDDPYIFGQIAACNALSDVYAMNATPVTALNIVCFDDQQDLNILGRIIEGGNDKLKEAHVCLAGGHSIKDDSIKYGLSVTGVVPVQEVIQNHHPHVDDYILLTKPLGTGLTMNALRLDDCTQDMKETVLNNMTTLNKYALDLLKPYHVHALSDVTGFGLLVHLDEMLDGKVSAILDSKGIPYFEDCRYYVNQFYLTGSAQNNRHRINHKVCFEIDDFELEEILFDPQTSGGLLVSVDPHDLKNIQADFKKADKDVYVIGRVIDKENYSIYVKGNDYEGD